MKSPKINPLWWAAAAVALIAAALALRTCAPTEQPAVPTAPTTEITEPSASEPATSEPEPMQAEMEDTLVKLSHGLVILNTGAYDGAYMEDGTDETVSGVLMIVVKNTGSDPIQYADITLPTDAGQAKFTLSTLPSGASCVLLEQTRMAYTGSERVSEAESQNVAFFTGPLTLHEDRLQLQLLDDAINVVNISGGDISGDVVIYYKNAASDLYYGGITYRVRLEGGLAADEVRQIMPTHFTKSGSEIMFITTE